MAKRRGYVWSGKNQRMVYHRSALERNWYALLERQADVMWFKTEPVRIPYVLGGRPHHFIPDLLVCHVDRRLELIEIKPENKQHWKQNLAKFEAARVWCESPGRVITFRVVGYDELKLGELLCKDDL